MLGTFIDRLCEVVVVCIMISSHQDIHVHVTSFSIFTWIESYWMKNTISVLCTKCLVVRMLRESEVKEER